MSNLFSQVLNMSMTGSVVILLVMVVRLLLKRAPKIFSYALWSVVLFRLLCPVALTAPISVLDVMEPEQRETSNNTSIVSYIPATVDTQADFIMVQPEEQQVQVEAVTEPEEQLLMTPMHAVALVWAAGMAGMMLYSVVQYLALRKKLVGSMQLQGNIYLADHIDTAFVVGLLEPRIYLPSNVPSKERYYILAHEQHHIHRFDHVIKLLAYLALCIHWFNPLVWIAFVLAGKDMEMSCDEAVIKKLGAEIRADYSASLLRLATHKKILSGMPLAFGEGDTKGRVLNMAKWKKPKVWVSILCVLICVIVLVACALNPATPDTLKSGGFGECLLGENSEDLTQNAYTEYLQDAFGLTALTDHKVYYNDGVFQVDFRFSEEVDDWQLDSAKLFAYTKFFDRGIAKYDLWDYDTWLTEHRNEITKHMVYRMFVGKKMMLHREFYVELPADLSKGMLPATIMMEADENGNILLTKGIQVAGGLNKLQYPDFQLDAFGGNMWDWVSALDVPENVPDERFMMTVETSQDKEYTLSATYGKKGIVETEHYFFEGKTEVYDLWFDAFVLSQEEREEILHNISCSAVSPRKIAASSLFRIGQLPQGYTFEVDADQNYVFKDQTQTVGGITAYVIPEGVYDPTDAYFSWLEKVGIPDFEDESLCYMGSVLAGGNGWLAEFASDVPPGVEPTVNRRHHLYPVGDMVYDIWFDMMALDHNTSEKIRASINTLSAEKTEDHFGAETAVEAKSAVNQCKSVLNTIQEGSYHIACHKSITAPGSNHKLSSAYFSHDEDWMHITYLNVGDGDVETQYRMRVNGKILYNVESPVKQNISWSDGDVSEPELPWLTYYKWDDSKAVFKDMHQIPDQKTITFQINEPFYGFPEESESYLVTFFFDGNGNFLQVELQSEAIRSNGLWTASETESVISLDPESVNAKIQAEYQRIAG